MTSVTQDPIDRFTLRIEELRRVPTGHGPARLVHNLILDIFMSMLRLFASLAEQVRTGTLPTGTLPTGTLPTGTLPTGTLPDTAPAPRGGGSPRHGGAPDSPRVRPPELLARQIPEAASNGRTTHGLFEQPEMPPEIKQPIAEAPQVGRILPPPCRMPGAGLKLPRRARLRKLKDPSGPAAARPQHGNDGCWPRWLGPGPLRSAVAEFWQFFSKNGLERVGRNCVQIVSI